MERRLCSAPVSAQLAFWVARIRRQGVGAARRIAEIAGLGAADRRAYVGYVEAVEAVTEQVALRSRRAW